MFKISSRRGRLLERSIRGLRAGLWGLMGRLSTQSILCSSSTNLWTKYPMRARSLMSSGWWGCASLPIPISMTATHRNSSWRHSWSRASITGSSLCLVKWKKSWRPRWEQLPPILISVLMGKKHWGWKCWGISHFQWSSATAKLRWESGAVRGLCLAFLRISKLGSENRLTGTRYCGRVAMTGSKKWWKSVRLL